VAVRAVFLVMVPLAVLVVVVPQLITRLFTRAALEIHHLHLPRRVTTAVLVKVLTGFQKRQVAAAAHLLLGQIMPHQVFLALVGRVLQIQSAELRLPTQAVVAVAVLLPVQEVRGAAALAQAQQLPQPMELPTSVVVAEVKITALVVQRALAAQA